MQNWKLKVFSGTHRGAEVLLSQGEVIIGSDESIADFVFSDAGIADEHLCLDVTEDGVVLKSIAEGQSLTVDGELQSIEDEEIFTLAEQAPIKIGEFRFVLAKEHEVVIDWTNAVDVADSPSHVNHVTATRKTSYWPRIWGLTLTLIVPTTALAVILLSEPEQQNVQPVLSAEPVTLIREILSESTLEDVRVEWNSTANEASLEGYVETLQDKQRLLSQIDALQINYKSQLRTMEEIGKGVQFILRNLGYHQITVESGDSAGTVLLTGYIDDSSRWTQVEQILERDIPGLLAWKVQLQRAGAHLDNLRTMFEDVGLADKVQLVEVGDRIEVRGELDDAQITSFYQVNREFREAFGDSPQIVLKSIPKISKSTEVEFPVRSISLGRVPYVILNNNAKYMEGARLPSGYSVSSIRSSGIELTKGNKTVNVKLNEHYDSANDTNDNT